MDINEVKNIYDRLSEMQFKVESQSMPNPRYLNEKIGECHRYLEEVERDYIKVCREIAVIQQALNNSTAEYEDKKETLISQDEKIKSLPNIRDREARANSSLKEERQTIKNYNNDLAALNGLYRALNLRNKNLNRANQDIKYQIKLMEAQIKLGTPHMNDPAVKSLMEELQKGISNTDVFEKAKTTATVEEIVDPTSPINVDDLLKPEEPAVSKDFIEPMPDLDPEGQEEELPVEDEESPLEGLEAGKEDFETVEDNQEVIDLDDVIDEKSKTGGEVVPMQKTEQKVEAVQKGSLKKSGIDLDSILDDLNITN
jgi:hypothetical protein